MALTIILEGEICSERSDENIVVLTGLKKSGLPP
jgi:hypothetical protein